MMSLVSATYSIVVGVTQFSPSR